MIRTVFRFRTVFIFTYGFYFYVRFLFLRTVFSNSRGTTVKNMWSCCLTLLNKLFFLRSLRKELHRYTDQFLIRDTRVLVPYKSECTLVLGLCPRVVLRTWNFSMTGKRIIRIIMFSIRYWRFIGTVIIVFVRCTHSTYGHSHARMHYRIHGCTLYFSMDACAL